MRRLSLRVSLALIFLADAGFSVAANDAKTSQGNSIVPVARIACSLRGKAADPSDPPSTSAIPSAEKFAGSEHFREDVSPTAEVKISWLGATFVRRFVGKVEDHAGSTSLQTHHLSEPTSDQAIIVQLGQGRETGLIDVWCLLRLQANGEDGALRINSTPNIFFVRDVMGELGVIDAIWGGAGWEIGASPVGNKRRWSSGTRIFSR
jgi:hypothetical protein